MVILVLDEMTVFILNISHEWNVAHCLQILPITFNGGRACRI